MKCDGPGCTGVHNTSRPSAELCPQAKRRRNERERERWANDHEFRKQKNARRRVANMTPEQVEQKNKQNREQKTREVRTPGTYAYNAAHGIGRPGETRRLYMLDWQERNRT